MPAVARGENLVELPQISADERQERQMADETITLELDRGDAEVLLGVLASERHNADAEAVCDSIRKQIDQKLAEAG